MLQDSASFFRSAFDNAGAGMAVFDSECRLKHCNSAFCAMLGYDPGELAGRRAADILDDEATAIAQPGGPAPLNGERRFRRKNGSTFIGQALSCTWPDGHVQTTVLDVTERRRAEEKLRLTTECFELALKGSPVSIFCQDRDLRYTYVYNPTFGVEVSEILGKLQDEIFENSDGSKSLKLEVIRSGEPRRREVVIRSHGAERIYDLLAEPMHDSEGNISGVRCASIDITERKRAEEAVRQAEALERRERKKLETTLAALPAAVLIAKDAGCTQVAGNPAAYEILQCPPGSNLSKSDPASQAPANYELYQDGRRLTPEELPLRKAAARRAFAREEMEIRFAGGGSKFLVGNALPLFDDAGEVCGAVAAHVDITDLKRTEAALRKSEEQLRRFVEQAPAAIAMFDRDMRYLACSRRWLSDYWPIETSVVGLSHYDQFPETISEEWKDAHRRGLAGEIVRADEDPFVRPDGRTQWLRWEVRPWLAADSTVGGITILSEDVTERVEAVRALRESELRMRLAQEGAKVGTWEWRLADNRTQWSDNLWSLHALSSAQYTPSFDTWASSICAEDRDRVTKTVKDAAACGEEYEIQWRVSLPEGEPERWLMARGSPIAGASGAHERYIGVVIDITDRKRMEEALRQAEKKERHKREELEAILAAIPAPVLIAKDASCEEMVGNPAAYELYGVPPGANLAKSAPAGKAPANFEIFQNGRRLPPEDLPIRRAAAKRPFSGEEIELRFVEGDSKYLLGNALPLLNSAGEVRGAVAAFVDVTELKRTVASLRKSKERLRFALDAANAGTWEVDLASGKIAACDRALAFLGIAPGATVTHEMALSRVHPEDRARLDEALRQSLETGQSYRIESRALLPDGSIRWLEGRGERRGASGAQVIAGLVLDITERKRSEDEARAAKTSLEAALAAMTDAVFIADAKGRFIHCNDAFATFHRCKSKSDCIQSLADCRGCLEIFHADGRPASFDQRPVPRALAGETAMQAEYPMKRKDTGESWVGSFTFAPIRNDAGEIAGAVVTARDVTDQKRAAEVLKRSEARYRTLIEATDAVTWSCPPSGLHVTPQADWMAYTGQAAEEMLGDGWTKAVHPDELASAAKRWAEAAAEGKAFTSEHRIRRHDGVWRWMSVYAAPIKDAAGAVIEWIGMNIDITERRNAEAALKESEGRLSSLIDTAADSIVVIDGKGTIQSANRATFDMFGYSPEELLGQPLVVLMPDRVGADHDLYLSGFSGKGGVRHVEGKRKDGSAVPVDVAVAAWRDGEGRRFITGIMRDVSERKRHEDALADARRREAVGRLAGGVAHDFNNLLHVISGNLEIAKDLIRDEGPRKFLERARLAAEKGSALNQRLLTFARKRALKPESLNLNDRVRDTVKLLASTVGEHISVATDLAAGLWPTLSDPGEIDSAILNLAANARDAMPHGGAIRIVTSNVTLGAAAAAAQHADVRPGDYVCLSIADNGPGMPPEVLAQAFEPFFTTKGPGAGTGLGLASVASFAKHAGGFASIESAPGEGCTVKVHLPRAHENAAAGVSASRAEPAGGGELVLVVEDDDQVREMTLLRLKSLGYAALEARTGPEAIERLKSRDTIRLVLSDIVMPGGMTGYDVARWTAANRPGVKVIMCSGYNEGDVFREASRAIEGVAVLGKPYTRTELASAVSRALAS
jgi:PAS domain S-box-containing protein